MQTSTSNSHEILQKVKIAHQTLRKSYFEFCDKLLMDIHIKRFFMTAREDIDIFCQLYQHIVDSVKYYHYLQKKYEEDKKKTYDTSTFNFNKIEDNSMNASFKLEEYHDEIISNIKKINILANKISQYVEKIPSLPATLESPLIPSTDDNPDEAPSIFPLDLYH